jgi:hypothetical protein
LLKLGHYSFFPHFFQFTIHSHLIIRCSVISGTQNVFKQTTNTCKKTVCYSHDCFTDVFDSTSFQIAKPFARIHTLLQTLGFQLSVGMTLVKCVCILFVWALVASLYFPISCVSVQLPLMFIAANIWPGFQKDQNEIFQSTFNVNCNFPTKNFFIPLSCLWNETCGKAGTGSSLQVYLMHLGAELGWKEMKYKQLISPYVLHQKGRIRLWMTL